MRARSARALFAAVTALASTLAAAHADGDHAPSPAAAQTNGGAVTPGDPGPDVAPARRTADASVFVSKAIQYQLGLRTKLATGETLAATVELAGTVVADPDAGGRVQASQAGRIEPGPKGMPTLGQRVTRGQVLAWVRPTIDNVVRGNQQAELASLDAQLTIARSRLARYEQLEGAIPRKDIDAARVEAHSLQARRAAVVKGLSVREPLRAPVSGVVSAAALVAGQIVEPREVLAEIVDPARLAIEALAYEPALAAGVSRAVALFPGGSLDLQFVGAGRHLRGQALPLLFRAKTSGVPLAIGQPLQVIAQTARRIQGIALPRAALLRDRSGELVIWVHTGPEQFVPRRVVTEAVDADTVAVISGLAPGERVVVAGASLLAQVR